MKKKQLNEIIKVISDLTKMETSLARQAHYEKFANRDKILEWFNKIHNITSRLDTLYKTEMGIK